MRIGMILDKTFPPDPRVENEAMSLLDAGHEVFLFCLGYGSDQKKEEKLHGIEVRRYATNTLAYKMSALAYTFPFYSRSMAKKISHFLRRNNIEIVHIHDMRIAAAVWRAIKKIKLPVVLDLHDNIPEIMKYYPHVQKFPGNLLISPRKWKIKEEEFINKADKVITVSKEFRNEVLQRMPLEPSRITVVPNTVRKSFYENVRPNQAILDKYSNDFVILYLGDTGLRRGLLTAIKAMTIIKEKIEHSKLVIVGSNSEDAILKEQVKQLALTEVVDFQGWQDVALFPSYILASEICISPLDRNIQHDVAYANKIFQYMSFAKPLLVSDALAQKNLIERIQSGLVHLEKDPQDFADKIEILFKNEAMRKELGNRGKEFIEKEFSWEITGRSLCEVYQEFEN